MHDELGVRMKENYENRSRQHLPRRTYVIMRLDGKAFHTFTKGFNRPYDLDLMALMDRTAERLCRDIQGAKFAYTQSDEISILITDFDTIKTDAWFDNNVQKMVSVGASIATAEFNERLVEQYLMLCRTSDIKGSNKFRKTEYGGHKSAVFDARVFTMTDPTEVENYFIWRQNDAARNSIQMAAQSMYSHKELHEKGQAELQDMIHAKGQNWNDYPAEFKRGRVQIKKQYEIFRLTEQGVLRNAWFTEAPPIFTQEREYLKKLIPRME